METFTLNSSIDFNNATLDELEEEAIEFIKKYEPEKGYFVSNSGGKDSIVLDHIAKRSGVKISMSGYAFTGIDPPEVVKFLKEHYPNTIFFKPKITFWQGVLKKNPPLITKRWCCDVLKKDPMQQHPSRVRLAGVRAEESSKRRGRGRVQYFKKYKQHVYYPIFWFSTKDIWEYIKKYNLPYCKLYDEGHKRLGCVVCPMLTKEKVRESKKCWPLYWKTMEKYLTLNYQKHEEKLKEHGFTLEQYLEWPLWKSKDTRNNTEMDFNADKK